MSFNLSLLRSKRHLVTLALVLFVTLIAPDLFGEEAPAVAGEEKKTLMDKIMDAGVFMAPIGILSVLMITLAVSMLFSSRTEICPTGPSRCDSCEHG